MAGRKAAAAAAAAAPEASRVAVLEKVFNKALDVSEKALTDEALVDAFGDLKLVYGNQLDRLFRNMIDKTQKNMVASYRDICIRNEIDEGLRNLENAPPVMSAAALLSTEDPLASTLAELRRVEADNLRAAIKTLESECAKLQQSKDRAMTNLATETEEASGELQKLRASH